MTKFFVEYVNVESASAAKQALDGTKLCDSICKMSIYFSNFAYVDLKHQTTEGIDYESLDDDQSSATKIDQTTKSTQAEYYELDDNELMLTFAPFSPLARSKTDNPRTLGHMIEKINRTSSKQTILEEEVDKEVSSRIDLLLNESNDDLRSNEGLSWTSAKSSMKLKDELTVSTTILCFDIVEPLEIKNIYNVFSNFGNISVITLKKNKAFIRFRTPEFAAISLTYLQNCNLMGNLLNLQSPRFRFEEEPKENEYCECMYYDSSSDRFTAQRSITINPPSNTLHISSIKREICKEKVLHEIFSDFGEVDKIRILQQSNEKNMALIKFVRIEDSFNAISELHNKSFVGRKMQISFTKSKL